MVLPIAEEKNSNKARGEKCGFCLTNRLADLGGGGWGGDKDLKLNRTQRTTRDKSQQR